MPQLLSQAFVEGEGAGFGAGIIDIFHTCNEASQASQCDNVAMVMSDHCWEELLDEKKVGNRIDIKDSANLLFTLIENGSQVHDACIIDQDCGISMFRSDFLCDFLDAC